MHPKINCPFYRCLPAKTNPTHLSLSLLTSEPIIFLTFGISNPPHRNLPSLTQQSGALSNSDPPSQTVCAELQSAVCSPAFEGGRHICSASTLSDSEAQTYFSLPPLAKIIHTRSVFNFGSGIFLYIYFVCSLNLYVF